MLLRKLKRKLHGKIHNDMDRARYIATFIAKQFEWGRLPEKCPSQYEFRQKLKLNQRQVNQIWTYLREDFGILKINGSSGSTFITNPTKQHLSKIRSLVAKTKRNLKTLH